MYIKELSVHPFWEIFVSTCHLSLKVFFAVDFKFTIELTDVNLIGSIFSSAPRILRESQRVVLTVHEEFANSEVSFNMVLPQGGAKM